MTDSPSVTCPSPARTTLPLRRMDKTVVERISRFVDMGAILDYSSEAAALARTRAGRLRRQKKTFAPQRHGGTEKDGQAEKMSIAKQYTLEAKLLTAMTI